MRPDAVHHFQSGSLQAGLSQSSAAFCDRGARSEPRFCAFCDPFLWCSAVPLFRRSAVPPFRRSAVPPFRDRRSPTSVADCPGG
jgi:hypothetical protein